MRDVSVSSSPSAHLCRFPARTISESLPSDGSALVKTNAGVVSVHPLSVPEICGRGPSADAVSIQTCANEFCCQLLVTRSGEEVRIVCSSLERSRTLAMKVSLNTCQNNVCSAGKCCAVHRNCAVLCLH